MSVRVGLVLTAEIDICSIPDDDLLASTVVGHDRQTMTINGDHNFRIVLGSHCCEENPRVGTMVSKSKENG